MKEATKKDKCVMCGEKTPYGNHVHIDLREHYVEGTGQMCRGCYTRIY